MSSNLHRNSTEANKHTPKGFDLADNNSTLLRDERGQSRYIDNLVNERVENLVDGFNAPPTTTSGHLYVLIDNGSGTVNTDWNGANYNDIVRIQDGVWVAITPVNGYLVFNKADEKYYKFGSTGWQKLINLVEDTTPQLGGDLDLNGNDINGTGNVDITGNVIADIVQLRGGTGTQGEMSWNTDEETVQLVMDGTTLHIGQDTFVHARNNTASIITKGTAVYATGTLGASGRITVAPMIADGTIAGRLFIGLTAEDIAIGADGQVCSYGKIRGINTTAYNDGDVLWLSPTVAGQLTATEPTAPNLKIATAFVIHDATNGTLMVRAEQGNDLHSDQRVQVSGLANNDVLTWNNTNQRWQNAQPTSTNIYANNGTIGSNRVATITDTLSFLGGRVSFDTTTNGILLPRLTTVQMNGISSPATNLLVYNTDLNGLYRYNGSAWVALSVGYGIIGVYSGSGNGTPVFFADLQSALETCKASGGYFTVKLYSNLTITSAIEIDYANTGVGNAYLFRQLTIDFNGFSVTNAQANTSNAFTINLSNSISVYQEVRFVNGNVFRTNGTGTHFGLFADGYGTIQMNKMYWFCENHITARIHTQISTANQSNKITDLGGSTFISQTHTALGQNDNTVGAQNIRNFNAISYGAQPTVRAIEGVLSDFTSENTSTGIALNLEATAKAERFYAKSNSGNCVNISGGLVRSFRAISVTGRAVNISTSGNRCDVDDFYSETGNNYALFADNDARITNGKCVNNGATDCVRLFVFNSATNIEATNLGSGVGINILNLFGGRTEVVNCTAISFGGIGGIIDAQSSQICHVDNCNFVSDWNNAGGHAIKVTTATGGTIKLTKCNLKVKNASANAINATSAVTVRSRYCTHNDVATTPINANVTIVSSGIIS